MFRLSISLIFLGLSACAPSTQTSSGNDYISATSASFIDDDIAKAAAIEPNLRFPARIVNGGLTLPPPEETALFTGIAERNSQYGEFVAVSPLVMAMVTDVDAGINRGRTSNSARAVIHQIRLAAARQHLDYVIVYEVGARSRTRNTPFALADVTLLGGMLLPTRNIDVAGIGAAAFIDVRNGYPYSTTQVSADLSGFARSFQVGRRSNVLQARATLKVAEALVPDIEKMLAELAARAR
ncbi:hypothetical protein ACJ5NV_01950 [Loktanella agnita]|uniref:hypothetical protein n=1 Tax=Loktanella agnita TaxID=287097 RepID=UPI00398840A6